ncbi:hypothetical protein RCH23_002744 [Cryobacterium sp. CAN_C3]|nr:hypothetical protein [Cryobacterium sp. CAN_C3]
MALRLDAPGVDKRPRLAALSGVILEHTVTTTEPPTDDPLLDHLSPLGWEHINLTGDYTWNNPRQPKAGKLRPLHRAGNS